MGNIRFVASDWWAGLPADAPPFDLVVANPPYVASGDRHLAEGDLRFEPKQALVAGADGLGALRTIVAGAAAHLRPGGWLLVEHGHGQAAAVRALLVAAGLVDPLARRDLAGILRVAGARHRL
jgi:release factor glutamine methyltransferase